MYDSYEIDFENLSHTRSPFYINGIGFVVPLCWFFIRYQYPINPPMHVANHNVAAAEAEAEAIVLSMKAALETALVYDFLSTSAATSRMFEVRGPMLVAGDYDGAGMEKDIWEKDLDIIGNYIDRVIVKAPLFAAPKELYQKGLLDGLAIQDTASV